MKAVLIPVAMILAGSVAACGGSGSGSRSPPTAPNQPPVAQPDMGQTRPGVAVEIAVLANDSDPEGGILTILPPGPVVSATVTVLTDNRLRVLPEEGFGGTVEFTYQVQDASGVRSAPAIVRVTVAPAGRVMLGTYGAGGTMGRILVSGRAAGESESLLELACPLGQFAASSSDMRTLVAVQCGATPGRRNLVVMAPRAPTLAAAVPLLTNVALVPGFSLSADGNSVIVAEKVTNPDDSSVPGDHELVRIDVPTLTVSSRTPLPDLGNLTGIRPIGGGAALLLATGGGFWLPGLAGDLYHADLQSGAVVRIGEAFSAPALEMVFPSADGRYVLYQDFLGNLVGYHLDQPTQQIQFWDMGTRGMSVIELSVAPAPNGATMLLMARDFQTQDTEVWVLPLDDPAAARSLRPCKREWTAGPAFQIRSADRFLLVCDGALAGHSEVLEISLSDGAVVRTWTPAGGVSGYRGIQRMGSEALLIDFQEPVMPAGTSRRIAYVHSANPGQLAYVLPDTDLTDAVLGAADREGTAFALTTLTNGVRTAQVVDVNLLTRAFPVSEGLLPGEEASSLMIFSPPDG